MKPVFISEDQVADLVTVDDALRVVAEAFRGQAEGDATSQPRHRLRTDRVLLHMLAGAIPGYFGYKAYTTGAGKVRFNFFLFDSKTTELLALMEADRLGQIRTGAATGVATRLMANEDAEVATMFGAGWQAESQLLAIAAVRNVRRVWIVNRRRERAEAFVERMSSQVEAELKIADSPEEAVRESSIVTTITGSREPVLFGKWLEPGTHVNLAGGNMVLRREADSETIVRADRIVVDSIDQARTECGEFVSVFELGRRHWEEVVELKDVVVAGSCRKSPEEITLFKSLGIGLEDVALGRLVYERAKERNIGRPLDI